MTETIVWTLCQLSSQLSNAGDPKTFAALCVGVAELVEDAAQVLEIHSCAPGHRGQGAVLCCFGEAVRRMCDDAGPDTPPQSERDGRGRTGRKPASGTDAGRTETRGGSSSSAARGLMVEIGDVEAAVAFASVACKLLTHALRVGPHVVTGFVSPSTARAVAHIVASPVANHALRRVALGCLKGVAVESGASVVPGETCLCSLASALFERSSLDLAAGPEREGYDGELAACVDAVLSAASAADVAAAAGACARGVVAIVAAGENACESNLRASAFRLLELSVGAKPALVSALVSLLPHAGSRDVADALVACLRPVFAPAGDTKTSDVTKRRRVAGVRADEAWVRGGESGAGPSSCAAWVEECIVSALHQLLPNSPGGGSALSAMATGRADFATTGPRRARAAAGLACVCAAVGKERPRLRQAGVGAAHEWLKWARRANDAGDGLVATAFTGVLEAAVALARMEKADNAASFNEDDLTPDLLLWPWGNGAINEAPLEIRRAAKVASLRASLAAAASRSKPSSSAQQSVRQLLQSAVKEPDPAVVAATAAWMPAASLLLGNDPTAAVNMVMNIAANDAATATVRAAAAVAVGGLAAAGVAVGAKAHTDLALRAKARDAGQRAIVSVGTPENRAVAKGLSAAVTEAVKSLGGKVAVKYVVTVDSAARVLAPMLTVDEDDAVAAAALWALPMVLEHAQQHGGANAMRGASGVSALATPLALHKSEEVRAALRDAAPALASRGVLLDAVASSKDKGELGDDDAKEEGLALLKELKATIEAAASDATMRESALQIFAAAAAALPHQDALTAALIVILHRLDDKDAGVRAAAVDLVRAAASRRGVRPRELLLGNRLLATHLGVALPSHPVMLSTMAEALLHMSDTNLLLEILPAAVPRLVERQDLDTLKAYAARLGPDFTVGGILYDWCYTAIADLINTSSHLPPSAVDASRKFLEMQTGVDFDVLVRDHKKELMRVLIRSAGANEATNLEDGATQLISVLGLIAQIADGAGETPSVPDFIRPHFTWLVMGDHNDRSGDAAAQRRFLRSLTIMVHLIGPHLPQFAPKVMAHLASALERPSLSVRHTALRAWLLLVKQLAGHAPDHLRRVSGRVVVAMLPHLPDSNSNSSKSAGEQVGASNGDGDDEWIFDKASAAAEVIDELILKSGKEIMRGHLARLPMLPACESLARANAAVSRERGEVPLPSLLATLTDGAEDESQAVRATALGELRRALRADKPAVSALLAGLHEGASDAGFRDSGVTLNSDQLVGRLFAALLRCFAGEGRTVLSRKVHRLAAQCLGELGAIDPGRIDMPVATAERVTPGNASDLARVLLCDHVARTVRGANDVDMLDAAALAVQEVLVHAGCRPASVRAEDVIAANDGETTHLPAGATGTGKSFWASLPEDVRVLLAPGLTSMYCLTQKPQKPSTVRPLYQTPGGPTFRRWMYAWCRALASEADGPDAPLFAACSAGVFRHDTRTMLFLLPRMVLDALAAHDACRRDNVAAEIMAVLRDAAGAAWTALDTTQSKSLHGEQAELAAQAVFTLLDQLTQWSEDADVAKDDSHRRTVDAVKGLLDSVPRELLARAALRCGAPARALLYFEDHLRAAKNVINQASLRDYPEGGGLDDASAAFLAATHQGLAEPDAVQAISRLRSRPRPLEKKDGTDETDLDVNKPAGVSVTDPSLNAAAAARRRAEDALLQHEQNGEWTEALTHYESALQRRGPDAKPTAALDAAEWGRLRCLQGLGHLRALEREADALITQRPAASAELAEAGAAAAWRLGRWDSLTGFLGVLDDAGGFGGGAQVGTHAGGGFGGEHGRPGGEAAVGRVLLALHRRDAAGVARAATAARDAVITPLAAAAMEGSYRRAHPTIVQLHLLREAEEAMAAVTSLENVTEGRGRGAVKGVDLLADWETRLELTPTALATREPILALRRATYNALDAKNAAAYTWLAQAKLCRSSGHHGAAQLALLEARAALEGVADDLNPLARDGDGRPSPGMALAVEQAKLLWASGKQYRAVVEIQEALNDPALTNADPKTSSSAQLRLARWSAATGQKQKKELQEVYKSVLSHQKFSEKANFHAAKWMDDLYKDATRREQQRAAQGGSETTRQRRNYDVDEKSIDYVEDVIKFYATSLRYGHRHVYESLPRMLTLWFDIGALAAAHEAKDRRQQLTPEQQKDRKVALKVTSDLKSFAQSLPLYVWLPALPQLTSRLCHPHQEVSNLVREMLYRLVKHFPNHVLWSMVSMKRSKDPGRAQAAEKIMERAKETAPPALRPLFDQSDALADQLIRVCAFQPKNGPNNRPAKTFSVKTEFAPLKRLTPCQVMVPGQVALTPSLPPPTMRNAANKHLVPSVVEWSAFNQDVATIASIEDEVTVLASLQKPKKLTIVGSDGQKYAFLCKPKDDLRKDLRMMEFTTMLNRLLARDPSSRKRRLYLRTFAVMPLNEDNGIIEWVPNTTGLRHVIQALYVQDGIYTKQTLGDVKRMHERLKPTPTTWMNEILKKFPPVLHRWFLNRWKDRPAAWHGARTAFAHTAAVWSMVGHVVGLGDRHGENILLDQESGDCVHVDFSCLFDKGLELETPEMVPFRLTQNIVDGLGAAGYEGTFMRVCEITLGVLRSHREALMSVLETFVHDPLVEWTKGSKAKGHSDAADTGRAKEQLEKIRSRLEGVVVGVGAAPSLPLSCQGQARRLIEEAVSRSNLGRMYVWWMSWN